MRRQEKMIYARIKIFCLDKPVRRVFNRVCYCEPGEPPYGKDGNTFRHCYWGEIKHPEKDKCKKPKTNIINPDIMTFKDLQSLDSIRIEMAQAKELITLIKKKLDIYNDATSLINSCVCTFFVRSKTPFNNNILKIFFVNIYTP